MTNQGATNNDQETFWNEEGGERWVEHIDHLETMLTTLSKHLIAAVDAQAAERVLDVGCGGGSTAMAYAKTVGESGYVLGVDISEVILRVARERYNAQQNLHFEQADAGRYAFTQPKFDVLASRFGVMFFPDPIAAFTNLRTAAKPAARLVFLCWRELNENPWMAIPSAAAFSVVPAPPKPEPGTPGPFSLATPVRIREILTTAGFGDIAVEKVDEAVNIGTIDSALDLMSAMGPAAASLREAGAAEKKKALSAMREALVAYETPNGVIMDGATWLVRAQAV